MVGRTPVITLACMMIAVWKHKVTASIDHHVQASSAQGSIDGRRLFRPIIAGSAETAEHSPWELPKGTSITILIVQALHSLSCTDPQSGRRQHHQPLRTYVLLYAARECVLFAIGERENLFDLLGRTWLGRLHRWVTFLLVSLFFWKYGTNVRILHSSF